MLSLCRLSGKKLEQYQRLKSLVDHREWQKTVSVCAECDKELNQTMDPSTRNKLKLTYEHELICRVELCVKDRPFSFYFFCSLCFVGRFCLQFDRVFLFYLFYFIYLIFYGIVFCFYVAVFAVHYNRSDSAPVLVWVPVWTPNKI